MNLFLLQGAMLPTFLPFTCHVHSQIMPFALFCNCVLLLLLQHLKQ